MTVPQYKFIDVETFTRDSTLDGVPAAFLVEGILHRSVTLFYGQTKSGKSTLAASLAVALASGQETWLGRPVAPDAHGPVAIVCGDPDSLFEYKERLFRVRDEIGDGRITLISPWRPTEPAGWEEVRSAVMAAGARVVIIDNLSQFVSGSLSDDDLIKAFYMEVDKFARQGIAVLVLAHVSEKPAVDGKSQRLPHGSSFIRYGPRWWALVWAGGGKCRLEFDGNAGGRWSLDVSEPDGVPRFDVLGSRTTEELKEGQQRRARDRDAQLLKERSNVGEWVVANCQGQNRDATAQAVAAAFPKYTVTTAQKFLSEGAFGAVKNVGTRNAPQWARVAADTRPGP